MVFHFSKKEKKDPILNNIIICKDLNAQSIDYYYLEGWGGGRKKKTQVWLETINCVCLDT